MKLFNLALPDSLFNEDTHAYLHYSEGCVMNGEGCILLNKGNFFSTDTYHNYLCINKLSELTEYKNFRIFLKGSGRCLIEVFSSNLEDHYTFDKKIDDVEVDLRNNPEVALPLVELCYLRISALEDVYFIGAEIHADIAKKNNVSLAYCICTFNREKYVKHFIENIAEKYIGNDSLTFYITNNGNDYSINYPENCNVMKNRNLGGAGGFTRAIIEAQKNTEHTHILLADDDILIKQDVIDKTLCLLNGLKPEYKDAFISGAMLSLEQQWFQYEKTCVLNDKGFCHEGSNIDIRNRELVARDIINRPKRGLAAWWYCVMPVGVVKEFELPLPIFVRGDDVEYSVRCARKNITLNGICVWHEPFNKKYNEIMEDYYLTRNMLLISYIYANNHHHLRKLFFRKKFIQNLLCFDYIAASLNLRAAEAILNGEFKRDAEVLHKELMADLKSQLSSIPAWEGQKVFIDYGVKHKKIKLTLKMLLQYIFSLSTGHGLCYGGFGKRKEFCIGKKDVVMYIGNNKYRKYHFDFKTAWQLYIRYLKLNSSLRKNEHILTKSLVEFRDQSKKLDAWKKILF